MLAATFFFFVNLVDHSSSLYLNLAVSWFDSVHHYNMCSVPFVFAWVGGCSSH